MREDSEQALRDLLLCLPYVLGWVAVEASSVAAGLPLAMHPIAATPSTKGTVVATVTLRLDCNRMVWGQDSVEGTRQLWRVVACLDETDSTPITCAGAVLNPSAKLCGPAILTEQSAAAVMSSASVYVG